MALNLRKSMGSPSSSATYPFLQTEAPHVAYIDIEVTADQQPRLLLTHTTEKILKDNLVPVWLSVHVQGQGLADSDLQS